MGKGEIGHWILVILDGHKHNECELTESDSAFYQLSLTTLCLLLDFFYTISFRPLETEIGNRVPVHLVTMVTMGPVCLMKLTRK